MAVAAPSGGAASSRRWSTPSPSRDLARSDRDADAIDRPDAGSAADPGPDADRRSARRRIAARPAGHPPAVRRRRRSRSGRWSARRRPTQRRARPRRGRRSPSAWAPSARPTACPGSRPRSCSRTGRCGAHRAASPTSRRNGRSRADTAVRRREHLEDVPGRADPGPRRGGRLGLDDPVAIVPARARARRRRSPCASCSTTRAACTTTSTTPTSTKRCWPIGRGSGRPRTPCGYVGKPYFKPGTGWHYSNTNYVILGLLAEAVGGRAPGRPAPRRGSSSRSGSTTPTTRAFEQPLGPLASAYRFSGPGCDWPPIPLGDGTNVVPFTSVVTAAGSAGSLASTADDLVTWARAALRRRRPDARSRWRWSPTSQVTAPFKPSIPYGLGVQAATVDGRPTLGHSGRLLGSRTVVRWLPEQGIAIAVLTNQSRNDPNLVVRALLRVVLGAPVGLLGLRPPTDPSTDSGAVREPTYARSGTSARCASVRTGLLRCPRARPHFGLARRGTRMAIRVESTPAGGWPAVSSPDPARCARRCPRRIGSRSTSASGRASTTRRLARRARSTSRSTTSCSRWPTTSPSRRSTPPGTTSCSIRGRTPLEGDLATMPGLRSGPVAGPADRGVRPAARRSPVAPGPTRRRVSRSGITPWSTATRSSGSRPT